jgi:hypothetical protein
MPVERKRRSAGDERVMAMAKWLWNDHVMQLTSRTSATGQLGSYVASFGNGRAMVVRMVKVKMVEVLAMAMTTVASNAQASAPQGWCTVPLNVAGAIMHYRAVDALNHRVKGRWVCGHDGVWVSDDGE